MKDLLTATPLRVLHVIPSVAPRYGGPSTVLMPMCEALSRLGGVHVEIATTDADGFGARLPPDVLAASPVPVHLFRRDFSEQWKFSRGLWSWLWGRAGDYDLLHVHSLWNGVSAAACAAARRHGVPFVVRPCGMLSPYTWSRSAWRKRLYWALVEKHNLAAAACVHVTSEAEGQEAKSLRLPGPQVRVIPLGLAAEAWDTPARPDFLRERLGDGVRGRPIVLFLGRLHPKKGIIDLLLPAFARLPESAFLVIAGGADDREPAYESQVREAVSRLGLENRCALLGAVAPHDRWALFDSADVFALPSHAENFGVVVTEAMARGVPVVITDGVQACEHVQAAEAGRVVAPDVDAVAAALEELISDPGLRVAVGGRGREYARNCLAWDGVARAVAAMYVDSSKPLPASP